MEKINKQSNLNQLTKAVKMLDLSKSKKEFAYDKMLLVASGVLNDCSYTLLELCENIERKTITVPNNANLYTIGG